jgi:MFS transporter, SP family, general alpha glucoside:H+ symporter
MWYLYRKDFGTTFAGQYILPALWVGLWNGLVQAGAAAGSVSAGWFQDRFGRRPTFLLGGILGILGTTASYTSGMPYEADHRRGLFLLAKIIIGFSCGSLMSVCQTWISEAAPKNIRGVLLGFYGFNIVRQSDNPL